MRILWSNYTKRQKVYILSAAFAPRWLGRKDILCNPPLLLGVREEIIQPNILEDSARRSRNPGRRKEEREKMTQEIKNRKIEINDRLDEILGRAEELQLKNVLNKEELKLIREHAEAIRKVVTKGEFLL